MELLLQDLSEIKGLSEDRGEKQGHVKIKYCRTMHSPSNKAQQNHTQDWWSFLVGVINSSPVQTHWTLSVLQAVYEFLSTTWRCWGYLSPPFSFQLASSLSLTKHEKNCLFDYTLPRRVWASAGLEESFFLQAKTFPKKCIIQKYKKY